MTDQFEFFDAAPPPPPPPTGERVLVSACLLGEPCRWHGRKVPSSAFVRAFFREHPDCVMVPVCPEQLGGLATPRPPVKRRQGRVYETCADKQQRPHVTGREVTAEFYHGAQRTLAIAEEHGCRRAILLRFSPSCDKTGITGSLLARHGIEVTNTQ